MQKLVCFCVTRTSVPAMRLYAVQAQAICLI